MPALLDTLHASRTQPVCLDLLNQAAAPAVFNSASLVSRESPWALVIGYEDNHDAVAWQIQQLMQRAARRDAGRCGGPARSVGRATVAGPDGSAYRPGLRRSVFKANLLPSATAAFCTLAGAQHEEVQLQAHAGNGIVLGHINGDLTLDRAAAMLRILQDAAAVAHGNVIVLRCPTAWKKHAAGVGRPRGDAWLMRRHQRDKLDPARLFNPGRFVDGI